MCPGPAVYEAFCSVSPLPLPVMVLSLTDSITKTVRPGPVYVEVRPLAFPRLVQVRWFALALAQQDMTISSITTCPCAGHDPDATGSGTWKTRKCGLILH